MLRIIYIIILIWYRVLRTVAKGKRFDEKVEISILLLNYKFEIGFQKERKINIKQEM